MIGFLPGFVYLGDMSKNSYAALKKPKAKILKGAIGVAGNQTGIYSIENPGANYW